MKWISPETRADRRERVMQMTRMGMKSPLIADILKVTTRTVVRDRRAMKISQPGPRRFTLEELTLVEQLLDDGASISEAARTIGRDPSSLWDKFPGRAWTRQQCSEWAVFCRQMAIVGKRRCG